MLSVVHIVAGAAIAVKTKNPALGLIFAFLSHYFLDSISHKEYDIKNIKEKKWKKAKIEFLKIFLDVSAGLALILIIPKNPLLALAGGLIAILPDALTFLNLIFPNKILESHNNLHIKIHFPKDKKTRLFWDVFSQIIVAAIAIFFLSL